MKDVALRLDDVGASTKWFNLYSKYSWKAVPIRISEDWLFLKALPAFRGWGIYREMRAREWEDALRLLKSRGAKLTVSVTAAWVGWRGELTPFSKKFPDQALVPALRLVGLAPGEGWRSRRDGMMMVDRQTMIGHSGWSLVTVVFFTLACVLPPVAIYAPKGTVILAASAALALLFERRVREGLRAAPVPPMVWACVPLLAWSLVSVAWATDPVRSLRLWASLVALVAVARILVAGTAAVPEAERQRVVSALVGCGALFLVLLAIENYSDGFIIEILKHDRGGGKDDYKAWLNPGNVILAVCAWPLVYAAARLTNAFAGAALLAAILVVVAFGASLAAGLAVVVSTAAFLAILSRVVVGRVAAVAGATVIGAALFWVTLRSNIMTEVALVLALVPSILLLLALFLGRQGALTMVSALLVAGLWAMPFVMRVATAPEWGRSRLRDLVDGMGGSWDTRWTIWEFATARIAEHPFIGWGLDASRAIPGGHAAAPGGYGEVFPLHPHNGFLQIWLELGAVGAFALTILLLAVPLGVRTVTRGWPHTAAVFAMFMAYMVLGQLSFGIWQNWWLATGIIAMTFCLLATSDGRPEAPRTKPSMRPVDHSRDGRDALR